MGDTGNRNGNFILKDYGKKSVFSSVLPGFGGRKGIPLWCYYVNRGQAIVSFGVGDKDHSIMEFYPAHQAYQTVKTTGFRTFVKVNGVNGEAFRDEELPHAMVIEKNGLKIWESNDKLGIRTDVDYYALPGERVGALVRKVTVTNISPKDMELELLDGMPAVVPYGTLQFSIKEMGHTTKAWMQVENVENQVPVFRTRMNTDDIAAITEVKGGNFSFAVTKEGVKLNPIVDPDVVFGFDTSLQRAVNFENEGLLGIYARKQVISNQYPCNFYGIKSGLNTNQSITIYELIGQSVSKETLNHFICKEFKDEYFDSKQAEASSIVNEICSRIETKTGNPDFDEYCRNTYMDNVLRGGFPIELPGNKIFYVYSRKHGDLERDYNFFKMLPEFYSQGNGNFRDVNQNRRMDTFFTPYVERENIKKFYNMIQLDGYNPLEVDRVTYTLTEEDVGEIFDPLTQEQKEELMTYLTDSFTPGGFYQKLEELGIWDEEREDELFELTIERAEGHSNAVFAEGYWADHWAYNLDLIENYLEIHPEKELELLLEEDYTYYSGNMKIIPRIKRYVITDNGIRQYNFLEEVENKNAPGNVVRERFGKGEPVKVTLIEKLLLLCTTKYAILDPFGMGVEMEGGKPGWDEALNGLPGLLGSAMTETYELKRLMNYTLSVLKRCPKTLDITKELAEYMHNLDTITIIHKNEIARDKQLLEFWNKRNDAKEAYYDRVYEGISGVKIPVDTNELIGVIANYLDTVSYGIRKAIAYGEGLAPAYFTYDVANYSVTAQGIVPEYFEIRKIPCFLEGPVKLLRLDADISYKKKIYDAVRKSGLYDKELGMYKVNDSLESESYEIGRARAFTPGWLENESIWLHMEYKYILELLKNGLYKEFLDDFVKVAIPFQDPEVYGRSIYENSSFIASSKNPNTAYHGKGFVARLSGSTVEFMNMWKIMMFGKKLFSCKDDKLILKFEPTIPRVLIGEDLTITATLLGGTGVTYHLKECKDYIPGNYTVKEMRFYYPDDSSYVVPDTEVSDFVAEDVRDGKVSKIDIFVAD